LHTAADDVDSVATQWRNRVIRLCHRPLTSPVILQTSTLYCRHSTALRVRK